ncbi:MAG: hypothetical protein WBL95_04475 [Microcoleus sp.]
MSKTPKPVPVSEVLLPEDEPSILSLHRQLHRESGIDFDEWWQEFKKGFVRGKRDPKSNFKTGLWTKPKYFDMTPIDSVSGARTIEYWPDESQIEVSYLLSGTTSDLISAIFEIMRSQKSQDTGVTAKGSKPLLKGWPCIKLYFRSEDGVEGVKQVRLVGYSCESKVVATSKSIKLLTTADIKKFSTAIAKKFGETKYCWHKGRSCLSYTGMIARLQGLEGYAYVKNEDDGIKLFETILSVFKLKPDMDGFNFSEKSYPQQFTPKTNKEGKAETKLILGKQVAIEKTRPVSDCYFAGAALYVDSISKPIHIVRGAVVLSSV